MASPGDPNGVRRVAAAARDFQAGFAHDQAGRRDRAEALYRKVLQKVPDHADALHLLGVIAHQRGRHKRAIELIERALAALPDFVAAHLNLGNALRSAGRRGEAVESYRRALALDPGYPIAYCNLAAIQCEQGMFEAALENADRAIALAPDLAPAHINCSTALIGLGRFAEAETALCRARELQPGLEPDNAAQAPAATLLREGEPNFEAERHESAGPVATASDSEIPQNASVQFPGRGEAVIEQPSVDTTGFPALYRPGLLRTVRAGFAHHRAGRLGPAEALYRRVLERDPDDPNALHLLGVIAYQNGRFGSAVRLIGRALPQLSELPDAHLNYGNALREAGRLAEAVESYRRAIELMPERAQTHRDLGWALAKLGRLDEAAASHRRAVALDPADAESHYALGASLHMANDLPAGEASLRQTLELMPDHAAAWHEIGTVLRSAGRIAEALSCFRRALDLAPEMPEIYRSLAVTGQQASEVELNRLRGMVASPERGISDRVAAGFALGMLLDNAERCDEAFPCFEEANALHRGQLAAAGQRFDPQQLRRRVDELIGITTPSLFPALAGWGNPSPAPVFIVGMPRSGTSLVEQIAASHSAVFGAGERQEISDVCDALMIRNRGRPIEQWDAAFAHRLADRHVAQLRGLGGGAARVIDKMPDNVVVLWLIAALFPSARIVLCQRDPRDVCLSCYFHLFTEGHPYAYDLADCGTRWLEVDRLATHWLRVLPLDMLVIDYEELVADLEGESRRLIEFLGLDWEPSCLDFHRTQRPVLTASAWQVRQPLYRRSVGRWRRYERHLRPLLQVLMEYDAAA